MFNKIVYIAIITALFIATNPLSEQQKLMLISGTNTPQIEFSDIGAEYLWAKDSIELLCYNGIINGDGSGQFNPSAYITKEQLAKLVTLTFSLKNDIPKAPTFADVDSSLWSYPYIERARDLFITPIGADGKKLFYPQRNINREQAVYSIIKACGYTDSDLKDITSINRFSDYSVITPEYRICMAIAVEKGIISGTNNLLLPKNDVTKAEICVMLERAASDRLKAIKKASTDAVYVYAPYTASHDTYTPIVAKTLTNTTQMQKWATSRGADKRFIDAAAIYMKYAEQTGLRAEVLYAQAAKETNFGKYTGNVSAEQNNFAGIKILSPVGDRKEDHETFYNTDDGVRAHFNHMCAYTGTTPVGNVHDRFAVVSSLDWSGSIKYVEELGGKWAPDSAYGISIINDYMNDLLTTI